MISQFDNLQFTESRSVKIEKSKRFKKFNYQLSIINYQLSSKTLRLFSPVAYFLLALNSRNLLRNWS